MNKPTLSLAGRRALVTGSTRGIGKAIALAFPEAGAEIWVHGTGGSARAEATLDEARALGAKAEFVEADLGFPDGVDILVLIRVETKASPSGESQPPEYSKLGPGNCRLIPDQIYVH